MSEKLIQKRIQILSQISYYFENYGYYTFTLEELAVKIELSIKNILEHFPEGKYSLLKSLAETRRNKLYTEMLILETVRMDIERNGYAHVSTNHIAEETGKSVAIIYKYFPRGKIDIIRKLFTLQLDQKYKFSEFLASNSYQSVQELIQLILKSLIQFHQDFHELNKAITIANLSYPELHEEFKELTESIGTKIMDAIQKLGQQIQQPIKNLANLKKALQIADWLIHGQITNENLFDSDEEMFNFLNNLFQQYLQLNIE